MIAVRRFSIVLAALSALAFSPTGCSSGDDAAPSFDNAPGSQAFTDDIHCKVDTDCQKGESCTDGLCQMKRCADNGLVRSAPPLRSYGFMKLDRELVVNDGSSTLQGYDADGDNFRKPSNSTFTAPGSIADIASGNVTGTRPEAIVTASKSSDEITVRQGKETLPGIKVGFTPMAVAVGDVNADGIEEILAVKSDGNFSICNAKAGTCEKFNLGVGSIKDATMGDVDGDGFAEAIFLAGDKVIVFNHDGGKTKQQRTVTSNTGRALTRIAAGDMDGDMVDELIGLENGDGKTAVHRMLLTDGGSFTVQSSADIDDNMVDVAVGGLGGETIRIAAVGQGNKARILNLKEDGSLSGGYTADLGGANEVTRVAFNDIDGNSVPARLLGAAKVVSGDLIPMAVLTPPPYSRTYSGEGSINGDGRQTASVSVGNSATQGTENNNSVTLSASLGISFSADIGPYFKASVGVTVSKSVTKSKSYSTSTSVSQGFNFEARPDLTGYEAGAVAVGCGCYNQYDYQVDDPQQQLGKDGGKGIVSIFLPIGGQTAMWSLKRYNQLAAASNGKLPPITVHQKAGDLTTYPAKVMSLSGKAIPADDLLFKDAPSIRVSDSASVNFGLTLTKGTSTSTSESTGVTVNGSVGVGMGDPIGIFKVGASVNASVGASWGNGYSVSHSKSTTISGSVPPLRDNPATPEDEFAINSYSFTPIVYNEHYTTPEKKEAGYYVVTYTVGK